MGARNLSASSVATALLAGGLLGAGIFSASPVLADDCGAREDVFVCAARLDAGPPTPGETAFINLVRGHVPGSDADLLVTGRGVCRLGRYGTVSGRSAVQQVATHLGTDMAHADQVLDAAAENICPAARFS
jgi:hypothetical protein